MRRSPPIPDFLQGLFQSCAQVGARALASAVESVLEDVGATAQEVNKRTSRAQKKLRKRVPKINVDEEE